MPKNDNVSKVMSANKAKGTRPEIILRQTLWNCGVKGYRVNYSKIPGKPDLVFTKKKLAIFVNGCFWHRCPKCNFELPRHNQQFWIDKFAKNTARDQKKIRELNQAGWNVYTVWECDLTPLHIQTIIKRIKRQLLIGQ